jgi:hypothetical protein
VYTELNRPNKIHVHAINTGNTSDNVHSRLVHTQWTESEVAELDRRTRKRLTLTKVLYPKTDVDKLNLHRNVCTRDLQQRHQYSRAHGKQGARRKKRSKILYEPYPTQMSEFTANKQVNTTGRTNRVKAETEALITAAHKQGLTTNSHKASILRASSNHALCRMRTSTNERVNHIIHQ